MKEEKSDIYMTQSQSQRLKDLPLGENYDGIPDKEVTQLIFFFKF